MHKIVPLCSGTTLMVKGGMFLERRLGDSIYLFTDTQHAPVGSGSPSGSASLCFAIGFACHWAHENHNVLEVLVPDGILDLAREIE